jgi:hypothetical protein
MFTKSSVVASRPCIESLEERVLFSTAEEFKLLTLLGYNLKGAAYTYKTTSNVDVVANGETESTTGVVTKTTVTVDPTKQIIDGRSSYVIKQTSTGDGMSGTSAWASDATGTYNTRTNISKEGVGMSVNLHDTRVGAQTMVVGQTYSDSGTFKGTFGGDEFGGLITGSFGGNVSASAKLFGREACTVGSKTYTYAVKGTLTIGLNGSVKMTVDGESISISMKATQALTFWAVPGKGIVKSSEQLVMNVSVPGQVTAKITVISKAGLVSYVMPS